MDQFLKTLTQGTRFTRAQLEDASRKQVKSHLKDEKADSKVDFFASNDSGEAEGALEEQQAREKLAKKAKKAKSFATQEEVNVFRKKKKIKVYGSDVPLPVRSFEGMLGLGIPEDTVLALKASGFKAPTPVQLQAVPLLAANRDAFVIAPTGSGKTVAFLLGLLAKILSPKKKDKTVTGSVKAVIVSPTRELAQQISNEMNRFMKASSLKAAYLGTDLFDKLTHLKGNKKASKEDIPDILVSTPLRLIRAIKKKLVDLTAVQSLVLDEADKLLELGFLAQMDTILAACTCPSLQKCLFSATITTAVEDAARSFMLDPAKIVIGIPNAAVKTVDQKLVYVGQEEGKLMALQQMLVEGELAPPVLIFAETIERVQNLYAGLKASLPSTITDRIDCIHSERDPDDREKIIDAFRQGQLWFLITTELLARGLDFPQIASVINYDFPQTTASYIHRVGRTARAGASGRAITLYTKEDAEYLRLIANVMQQSGCDVPEWMLQLRAKPSAKAIKAKKAALKETKRLTNRRQQLLAEPSD